MSSTTMDRRFCLIYLVVALVATQLQLITAGDQAQVIPMQPIDANPLIKMRAKLSREVNLTPHLFDMNEVNRFYQDDEFALRFLYQRSGMWRRAVKMASSTLRWRHRMGVNQVKASDFPCDLFSLGLIFEYGNAHYQQANGQYVQGSPVLWIRVGALGSVIKQMERLTPARLVSYAYNAPHDVVSRMSRKISKSARKRLLRRRSSRTKSRVFARRDRLITNYSVGENETIRHILRSIAWWLNDWSERHPPGLKATLVLDFENTDFAFASWSVGDFFVKLDDYFPNMFDQIIGFRYKPKLWSLHSPISMFNRIFKSRLSSSPETDRKLIFVPTEPQLSLYLPRVDAAGFTMLPEHVSGICVAADSSKAPAGCSPEPTAGGLYDPNFWQIIRNEFYYKCTAKPRN